MIEAAAGALHGQTLSAQVVIVGGGTVGIPMALSLADAGVKVLLLEAGQVDFDDYSQKLYAGSVADVKMHSPPDTYRQRRLGGSSAIWGGRCVPFDPIDLKARDYIEASGWPIGMGEIQPYYHQANHWLEAGENDYHAATALPGVGPLIRNFESDIIDTDGLERFSRPTDMYQRYKNRLAVAKGLRVIYGANCLGIRLKSDQSSVDHLDFATTEGVNFKVRADRYVLAVGGIETPRLLLASNDVVKEGVGNGHGLVGRFYMCHIAGNVGCLTLKGKPQDIRHGYEVSDEGIYCRRRIRLNDVEQERLGVNNTVFRLHIPKITDPAHKSGILSGIFMSRFFLSYEYSMRLNDGDQRGLKLYLQHFRNILLSPVDTVKFVLHWLFKRTLAARKFPSVILPNRSNMFSLEVNAEQVPNADSRITLSDELDALGMPRVNIDWCYRPEDVESVKVSLRRLADELERTGVGNLELDEENFEADLMRFGAYGGHHIGTARMASSPEEGVVDEHCQVHGVENLYIASSAVFPTSSQANPTLTIMALGLRLADRLKKLCNVTGAA